MLAVLPALLSLVGRPGHPSSSRSRTVTATLTANSEAFGDHMRVITEGPRGAENNYAYLILDEATLETAVTDPSQCVDDVISIIESEGLKLTQILTTHHHWDHAFANMKLASKYSGLEVVGGAEDKVEACTKWVRDGDEWRIGKHIRVTALNTRGHTDGHICYKLAADGHATAAVCTGDTMFVGGCGRRPAEFEPATLPDCMWCAIC